MAWTILILAGTLEVMWLVALKRAVSGAQSKSAYALLSAALAWLSFALLAVALRSIPAGTAYAAWTGIGAAGSALVGIVLFGESREVLRLISVGLIVSGIIGVKMTR